MGKVTDKIRQIMIEEGITLHQVYEKYPHLADLQKEEMLDEFKDLNEVKSKKELLKG